MSLSNKCMYICWYIIVFALQFINNRNGAKCAPDVIDKLYLTCCTNCHNKLKHTIQIYIYNAAFLNFFWRTFFCLRFALTIIPAKAPINVNFMRIQQSGYSWVQLTKGLLGHILPQIKINKRSGKALFNWKTILGKNYQYAKPFGQQIFSNGKLPCPPVLAVPN